MKRFAFSPSKMFCPINVRLVALVAFTLLLSTFLSGAVTVSADNDLLHAYWDLSFHDTRESSEIQLYVNPANAYDNTPHTFTTGWVGAFLAPYTGATNSGEFSQVGTISYADNGPNDLEWFVYAEPGVTCLQGIDVYYSGIKQGCAGSANTYIQTRGNQYNVYTMYIYGTSWFANILDYSGNAADVAQITYNSFTSAYYDPNSPYFHQLLFDPTQGTAEEFYDPNVYNSDPSVLFSYYLYHMRYYSVLFNAVKDWPGSANNHFNAERVPGQVPCPQNYGGIPNLNNDSRWWYAGTTTQCSFTFSL